MGTSNGRAYRLGSAVLAARDASVAASARKEPRDSCVPARRLGRGLYEVTRGAYGAIYAERGEHFQVAKYDQIPEARWEEVAEWRRPRITRGGGQAPEQGSLF